MLNLQNTPCSFLHVWNWVLFGLMAVFNKRRWIFWNKNSCAVFKEYFFKATILKLIFKEKELPNPNPYIGGWMCLLKMITIHFFIPEYLSVLSSRIGMLWMHWSLFIIICFIFSLSPWTLWCGLLVGGSWQLEVWMGILWCGMWKPRSA